jgi:hypothetical protein
VLLCGVQRILAVQPHATEKAPQPIQIELVDWLELVVEVGRQRRLVVRLNFYAGDLLDVLRNV